MSLTPYDEGFFDGYFGCAPNNPYRRGVVGAVAELDLISSRWDAGYLAGAAKAAAETAGLGSALTAFGNLIRGTP